MNGETVLARQPDALPRGGSILKLPWRALTPRALLEHFSSRDSVRYFTVPDPEETRREKIDAVLDNRFEFIGETHTLSEPPCWTDNPSADIEWHILLHKFHYATGLGIAYRETGDRRYLDKWVTLTSSWIDAVPPGFIASDVTGRRVQNWIYAYYYFVTARCGADVPADFHHKLLVSLHEQVTYLCAHLHPARNHRTLELHAIFLTAVVFPEFTDAAVWRDFSLAEIAKNMESDLLPDGVHCELSTDYHHLVLKNYLNVRRLAQLNDIVIPPRMDERLVQALEFSLHAHRPDGQMPSFSDGDTHSYLDLLQTGFELYGREDMLFVASGGSVGRPPRRRTAAFPAAGYYIVRSGWGEHEHYADERYLIFDCGPLGAGNHGHFDCLAIEMEGYGRALVVDPGRYTYHEAGEINWRARFRGTAYHNTVLVDGKNQTRYVPGPHKYKVKGPEPEHALRAIVNKPGFDYLHGMVKSAEYDAVHERRIACVGGEYWIVSDTLTAGEEHRYDLLFHLSEQAHGRVSVREERGTCLIETPHLILAQCDTPGVTAGIDAGFVSYRYGEKHDAPVVRFTQRASNAVFHTVLYPYRKRPPAIMMRRLGIWAEDGGTDGQSGAHAVCITIGQGDTSYTDCWFFADGAPRRRWRYGNSCYDGSYLLLRKNAYGEIVRLYTSPGAVLEEAGYPITGWAAW